MVVSLILGGLVVALLLGNLYFYLLRNEGDKSGGVEVLSNKDATAARAGGSSVPALRSTQGLQNTVKALNTKYDFLSKKMRRLEDLVVNNSGSASLGKMYNSPLMKKVDRLEEFRRDARIEIQALKDRLEDVEMTRLEEPKPEDGTDQMDKKIRKLVFNSRK